MLGQWVSMGMQQVAQSFLVYDLTGSAAILGIMSLASAIPQIALGLFGGALADRFPKKRLLQMSQSSAAFVALVIVITLATGILSKDRPGSWGILIATSIFSGVFNGLALPVRQALIPELVLKNR